MAKSKVVPEGPHTPIITGLRSWGCEVIDTTGPGAQDMPQLIVKYHRGICWLLLPLPGTELSARDAEHLGSTDYAILVATDLRGAKKALKGWQLLSRDDTSVLLLVSQQGRALPANEVLEAFVLSS